MTTYVGLWQQKLNTAETHTQFSITKTITSQTSTAESDLVERYRSLSIYEIVDEYASFWHLTSKDEAIKRNTEVLLEILDEKLDNLTKAKTAYDKAVYEKYIAEDDALVQKIASYIILKSTALIDLIDHHCRPLSHSQCLAEFDAKCFSFTPKEIQKARSVKQLDCIEGTYHKLPEVARQIELKVKEIGQAALSDFSQNGLRKNDTRYDELCDKALHCTIDVKEAQDLLKISPYSGTAEQIAEITLHEQYR